MKKSFLNSIPRLFQSQEQREREALAKIEQRRQEREARKLIVQRAATFKDRVVCAKQFAEDIKAKVDAFASPNVDEAIAAFATGQANLNQLGELLARREAISKYADAIKQAIHKAQVEPAERQLAEYERQHADVLKGIELEEVAADDTPFEPAQLPHDFFNDREHGSAKLVRDSMAAN